MFPLTDQQREAFATAVGAASTRSDARFAIEALYQRFADAVALRGPICEASGRCCRFEEYGHRLFVTTLEMAAFVGQVRNDQAMVELSSRADGGGCRFQVGGRCEAHTIRPFGCRAYYCDPTAMEWQNGQYEAFQRDVRKLHERLGVDYFYVEWRQAMQIVFRAEVADGRRSLSQAFDQF